VTMSGGCGPEYWVYTRREILDPQREAIGAALGRMGYGEVDEVRAGKTFVIEPHSPGVPLERLLGAAERGGVSTREVELVGGDRLVGRADGGGFELAVETCMEPGGSLCPGRSIFELDL